MNLLTFSLSPPRSVPLQPTGEHHFPLSAMNT
jgi:hypothetical protein